MEVAGQEVAPTPGGNNNRPEDKKRTISGIISLPDGDVAPAGGIKLRVNALNDNWVPDTPIGNSLFDIDLTIPEGQRSINYSLTVPADTESKSYIIWYSIENSLKYVQRGYYSTEGTVLNQSLASPVDASNGDIGGIDLKILPANTISGTVSLPEGDTAPVGGIKVSIAALNYDDLLKSDIVNATYTSVTIAEGENSVNYSLAVPVDSITNKYIIEYSVYSEPYKIERVYYSIDGITPLFVLATPVDISNGDVEGINVKLLPTNIISGTISLPDGDTAPAGGIGVSIYAGNYSTQVTIPEGENSVGYSLPVVTDDTGSGYTVYYYISPEYGYVQIGYYSTEGTVLNSADGTVVDVSSGTVDGINLELIPGNIISGTVFLPENYTAPASGITVIIEAGTDNGTPYDSSDDYYTNISKIISKGKKSVQYSLVVPASTAGSGYIVKCSIITDYMKDCGYYSDTGTTPDRDSATPVDVSSGDVEGIDIEILPEVIYKDIKIHISLPYGDVAPEGGIDVSVFAVNNNGTPDDDSDDFSFSTEVGISEGMNDAYCTLSVPAYILNSEYILYYEIDSDKDYLQKGYYSIAGTIDSYDLATPVDVNTKSEQYIGLNILQGTAIAGTVSLPDGYTAPAGGIRVDILAFNNNGTPFIYYDDLRFYQTYTIIPEGKNSARYYLPVPPQMMQISAIWYVTL